MSFERPSEDNIEKKEKTLLELKNEMQSALISHACTFDDEKCIQDWLNKNADNFHVAYDKVGGKYGDMFDLWDMDRNAVLDNLHAELHKLKDQTERRAA